MRSSCAILFGVLVASLVPTSSVAMEPRSGATQDVALYDAIVCSDPATGRGMLLSQPLILQQEVWALHLLSYLRDATLSPAQRSVVLEGIGLLHAGVMVNQSLGGPAAEAARADLAAFLVRIKAQFNRALARDIFMRIEMPGASASRTALWGSSCDCSTASDWCDEITNPFSKCFTYSPRNSNYCIPQPAGCGTFWMYACDGTCG
jgi:hypothetical protein